MIDPKPDTDTILVEKYWYTAPYFLLTIALLVAAVAYPVAQKALGVYVLDIILTGLMLSGLYAVANHRWVFRILAVVVLPIVAANWFVDPFRHSELLDAATSFAVQVFLIVVMVTTFVDVVRSNRVTADTIFGSVAVYLMFGVVMAMAYMLVNTLDPGSVIASVTPDTTHGSDFNEFLYFSFVTLTSVGYGDLVPIGKAARSVAIFEGIVGQLYIAILIARLVGIHVAQD